MTGVVRAEIEETSKTSVILCARGGLRVLPQFSWRWYSAVRRRLWINEDQNKMWKALDEVEGQVRVLLRRLASYIR